MMSLKLFHSSISENSNLNILLININQLKEFMWT